MHIDLFKQTGGHEDDVCKEVNRNLPLKAYVYIKLPSKTELVGYRYI